MPRAKLRCSKDSVQCTDKMNCVRLYDDSGAAVEQVLCTHCAPPGEELPMGAINLYTYKTHAVVVPRKSAEKPMAAEELALIARHKLNGQQAVCLNAPASGGEVDIARAGFKVCEGPGCLVRFKEPKQGSSCIWMYCCIMCRRHHQRQQEEIDLQLRVTLLEAQLSSQDKELAVAKEELAVANEELAVANEKLARAKAAAAVAAKETCQGLLQQMEALKA